MDFKKKEALRLVEGRVEYKKQPELVNLVEGVYGAYCALAKECDEIALELDHRDGNLKHVFPRQIQHDMDALSPVALQDKEAALVKESQELALATRSSEEIRKENTGQKFSERACAKHKLLGSSGILDIANGINLQEELFKAHEEIEMLKRDCMRGSDQFRAVEDQMIKFQDRLQNTEAKNQKLMKDAASYVARIGELEKQISLLKKENAQLLEKEETVMVPYETQSGDSTSFEIQPLQMGPPLLRQMPPDMQNGASPGLINNEKTLVSFPEEVFHYYHENINLRMQAAALFQQLERANEEFHKLHQAFLASQAEKDMMAHEYQKCLTYQTSENRPNESQVKMALAQGETANIRDEISSGIIATSGIENYKTQNFRRLTITFQEDALHVIQKENSLRACSMSRNYDQWSVGIGVQEETSKNSNLEDVLKNYNQQNIMSAEFLATEEKLKNADTQIRSLEKEIDHLQKENGRLVEKSSAAILSVENSEQEIRKLKQENGKLLNEVSFRVDQRDALQQELYCLKEDKNSLSRKYQTMMDRMQSLGLNDENFYLVYQELQEVSSKVKDLAQKDRKENLNIRQALQKVEELFVKNKILENSVLFHLSETERHEHELQKLKELVEILQKEKSDLQGQTDEFIGQIRILEAKLQGIYTANYELQEDNQKLLDRLADAFQKKKELEDQHGCLLAEKQALMKEIVENKLTINGFQNQIEILKQEGHDLRGKLEEKVADVQTLRSKIDSMHQTLDEMHKKHEFLSEEKENIIKSDKSSKLKALNLQISCLSQQNELDTLQQKFADVLLGNKNLGIEICKLHKLLSVDDEGDEERWSPSVHDVDINVDGLGLLENIYGKVKSYQLELSCIHEDNKRHLEDLELKEAYIKQLKQEVLDLNMEKQSIEESVAVGLQKLSNVHKEIRRQKEVIEFLEREIEKGLEREKTLIADLSCLRETFRDSETARLNIEEEFKIVFAKYCLSEALLDESEILFAELERENTSLMIESLAQATFACMLESILMEKDEELGSLHSQLIVFRGNSENRLHCSRKHDLHEVESQQLAESLCGSQEEQQTDEDNDFSLVPEDPYPKYKIETGNENISVQDHQATEKRRIGPKRNAETRGKEQVKHHVSDTKEYQLVFEDTDADRKSSGYTILEFCKEEKSRREVQSAANDTEETTSGVQEMYSGPSGGDQDHVKHLEQEVEVLGAMVRDLQLENIKLKGQQWSASTVGDIIRTEIHHKKTQSSISLISDGPISDQDEAIIPEDTTVRHNENSGIYPPTEQNVRLGTRFGSLNRQINNLQVAFEGLQEKFWRLSQDSRVPKASACADLQNGVLLKQFAEVQRELIVWLQLNNQLNKEVQCKFLSLNKLETEIARTSLNDEVEEEGSVSHTCKLQRDIRRMQEENRKMAEMLQAGSVKGRSLEFEVEKVLGKLRESNTPSRPPTPPRSKRSETQRMRVPLRAFLFGWRDQKKKKTPVTCTEPLTEE